jgi:hypothetical protein
LGDAAATVKSAERNVRAGLIKLLGRVRLRLIKPAEISDDVSLRVTFDVRAIERTRSRPFAIDAVPIEGASHAETTFMARASELGIRSYPVWCAAFVGAATIDYIKTSRIPYNKHAMRLEEPSIDTDWKV